MRRFSERVQQRAATKEARMGREEREQASADANAGGEDFEEDMRRLD
jgi:hypothetical protein